MQRNIYDNSYTCLTHIHVLQMLASMSHVHTCTCTCTQIKLNATYGIKSHVFWLSGSIFPGSVLTVRKGPVMDVIFSRGNSSKVVPKICANRIRLCDKTAVQPSPTPSKCLFILHLPKRHSASQSEQGLPFFSNVRFSAESSEREILTAASCFRDGASLCYFFSFHKDIPDDSIRSHIRTNIHKSSNITVSVS